MKNTSEVNRRPEVGGILRLPMNSRVHGNVRLRMLAGVFSCAVFGIATAGTTCDIRGLDPSLVPGGFQAPVGINTLAAEILVQSTFDVDHEGWRISGNGGGVTPVWKANSEGNGLIEKYFNIGEPIGYWDAPDKFLGDISEAHGGLLTFRSFKKHKSPNTKLVVLTAMSGLTVYLDSPIDSDSGWTRFSIPLDDSAPWKDADSELAVTNEEVLEVLANLVQLRIRGDYPANASRQVGRLDDVVIRRPRP